jgi:hypothetical protein
MGHGVVVAVFLGLRLAWSFVSVEEGMEGALGRVWAVNHNGRKVGVDAGGEVPAHAKCSSVLVASAKHDEVWAAEAVVEVVAKLNLYPKYGVERDPPFIFVGKVGCEVKLIGLDTLDGKRGWSGVCGAETEGALVGAERVWQLAISIDPDVALGFRRRPGGVVGALLPVVVVEGEIIGVVVGWGGDGDIVLKGKGVLVCWGRRVKEGRDDAVRHKLIVGKNRVRDGVVPEVVIGDCHLLVKVSYLWQETGVARGWVRKGRIVVAAAATGDERSVEARAVVRDGVNDGNMGAIGVRAMGRRVWFRGGVMVDGSVLLGDRRFTNQGKKSLMVGLVVQRWGTRWRLDGDGRGDRGGHWSGGNVVLSVGLLLWLLLLLLLLRSSGNGLRDSVTGPSQPEGWEGSGEYRYVILPRDDGGWIRHCRRPSDLGALVGL